MNKLLLVALLVIPGLSSANEFKDQIPTNPEPGKCYARVVVPAKYKTVTENILSRPESTVLKTIPAKYQVVEKVVVVREASEKTIVIPAVYKTVKENVITRGEIRSLVATAPKYEVRTKKILVKPEGFEWKKGKGPLQKVDNTTGEILCYTKTPAVYKTVTERVLVKEASTSERIIPAQYGKITKRVLVTPEEVVKKPIAALTKVIKVKEMVEPPREVKESVPASYTTVKKRELVSDTFTEWQPILCKTNATKSVISNVQRKLAQKRLYKGPIDGNIGSGTMKAISKYQRQLGLATGGLTEETLEKLSVSL